LPVIVIASTNVSLRPARVIAVEIYDACKQSLCKKNAQAIERTNEREEGEEYVDSGFTPFE